jgi:threonylcarbamoyladenosine tRNA methylthiotransferase MtaB
MVNDIHGIRETAHHLVEGFDGIERAFVQVQNGCDHSCTFCIIPQGRGNSRSVPIGGVAEHVGAFLAKGYNEIVFTGVDIASYGSDLPGTPTLGQMVRRVLALHPALTRLRLSSIDPAVIDDDLWRLIADEPRLMPHLHLSVQAGDDMVLKRMKRRHSRQDVIDICSRARSLRPDMVIGADIIAGFPTETDAMFENTASLVDDAGLTWLHVFPFSPREGTPAARMPQVNGTRIKERAARLRALGEKAEAKLLQGMVDSMQTVLVEKNDNGAALGRTANYAHVAFTTDIKAGQLADVHIKGLESGRLLGDMITHSKAA